MSDEREHDQSNPGPADSAAEPQADTAHGTGSSGAGAGAPGGGGGDFGGGGDLGQSSLGMDANIAALLACVLGPITGILFILLEKESRFVKFWAWQVTAVSLAFIVINVAVNFIPCLGFVVSLLLAPVGFVFWIIFMLKAYQGQAWKLPFVGDFAEQQAG